MQKFIAPRRALISLAAIVLLLAATVGSYFFVNVNRASAAAEPYIAIGGSYTSAGPGSHLLSHHANQMLTV